MRLAHLNGLRAFEATLRTGSFRAAATELGVTPAAVGQRVRALEDYLGRKLFDRLQNGVQPTNDAIEVAQELRQSMIGLDNVLGKLQAGRQVERLKLTIDQPLFEMWQGPRFAQFQAEHPEIEIETDISYRMVDLLAEDFDFAIRYAGKQPNEFESVTLFELANAPSCTAEFAVRYDLPKHPKTLQGVPPFHARAGKDKSRHFGWLDWCDSFGVEPGDMSQGQQFTELLFELPLARSGLGLAFCSNLEIGIGLKDGSIILPFDRKYGRMSALSYQLVSVRGRYQSRAHRVFRKWIINCGEEIRAESAGFLP